MVQEQGIWLGIGVVCLRAGSIVRGPMGDGAERNHETSSSGLADTSSVISRMRS